MSTYGSRPNGSSAIWRSNAIEIHDGITFNFYVGLPRVEIISFQIATAKLSNAMSSPGHEVVGGAPERRT